ncbi:MAG: hypothetical protein K0R61_3614 [Microvirga sp.]|jgi:hypothetical protein|nr:hypothetical protein [Microvirga sp.]
MAMAPQEWTIHALSVEFNKHPRVIARLVRDVRPYREESNGAGTTRYYRLSEAAPAIAGSAKPSEEDDQKLFIRKARAETEIVEAKAAEIKGELVPVAETATELERAFTAVRARLLAIPPKLAPILAPERPARARAILEQAVLEALSELEQTDVFEDEPTDVEGAQEE